MSEGRIVRFVAAARLLLLMQALAAAAALALSAWAVFAVWGLAEERDRLRAEVAAMRSAEGLPPVEAGIGEPRLTEEVRPPIILPMAVPVTPASPDTTIMPDTNMVAPANPVPGIVTPSEPAIEAPPAEQDCTGANASQPRCRPGRWNRREPVPQRQAPGRDPEPQSSDPAKGEPKAD